MDGQDCIEPLDRPLTNSPVEAVMATVKAQDRQSVAVRHFDGAKSRFLRTVGPSGRGVHVAAIGRLKIRPKFIWFA
jgi:hypothetical protein